MGGLVSVRVFSGIDESFPPCSILDHLLPAIASGYTIQDRTMASLRCLADSRRWALCHKPGRRRSMRACGLSVMPSLTHSNVKVQRKPASPHIGHCGIKPRPAYRSPKVDSFHARRSIRIRTVSSLLARLASRGVSRATAKPLEPSELPPPLRANTRNLIILHVQVAGGPVWT